jgi:cobalt/nickel transport system permease protein
MHTPDGLLTSWVCVAMMLASLVPILLALNNLRRDMTKDKALKLASVAAIIFAGQMLNFPIGGGTSGHLIGAAFAFIALGLDGAIIAVSVVLALQAVVFGDGGMLAFGANAFNMAIVGVYAARFAYARWGAFAASWLSVVAASISCAALLVASGAPLVAFMAMGLTHALIGIGEGLITVLLLEAYWNRNVSLSQGLGRITLAVSFIGLAALLPFASSAPDGLEKVALDLGFYANAATLYEAPMPDYAFAEGALGPYLSALLAGVLGTAAAFALAYAIAHIPSRQITF